MGYRSDVRIRLTKKDYEKMLEEYDKEILSEVGYNIFNDKDIFKELPKYEICEKTDDGDDVIKLKDCVYFGWDSIKWYENYTEIDFIIEFIKECEQYAFCRIGESGEGDIETFEKNMDMIDYHFIFDNDNSDYALLSKLYMKIKNYKELNDKYNLYDITIEDIINELIDNIQDDIDIIEDKFK